LDKDDGPEDLDSEVELFQAISHPVRIKILEALVEKPMGFAELGRAVGIESGGHLSFHLTKLGHLIRTNLQGNYIITSEGKEALWTLHAQRSTSSKMPAFVGNRIAILPFRNMSRDRRDDYFAEGITEEIISTVCGISGLEVISRTSVMGYKGTTKNVQQIGEELRVGSVLEGSFRKVGRKIRITVQLIEAARDRHLWGQDYDRNLGDLFSVQTDVAMRVADALRVRVPPHEIERIEKGPTESGTAYALYLKGRYLWNTREQADIGRARGYFELALHEAPNFALAYVGKADCNVTLAITWGVDRDTNLNDAKGFLTKALELDLGKAEAHATMGHILAHEFRPREAEVELRKGMELKPSYSEAHFWYSVDVLFGQLRWAESLEEIEKAVELDPLSQKVVNWYGIYHVLNGNYDKALQQFKRIFTFDPDYWPAHWELAMIFGRTKRYDDMRREFSAAVRGRDGAIPLFRIKADAFAAAMEDDHREVRRLLPQLISQLGESSIWDVTAYDIARLYFHIGENDNGFKWLERSCSEKEAPLLRVASDPDFGDIRDDPRYLDVLKRLGLEDTTQQE